MRVLICDKFNDDSLNKIRNAGIDCTYKTDMTENELVQIVPEYDIVVVRSTTKITKNVIDAASSLKLIIRAGIGLDNIDSKSAREKQIEVRNTPGASAISVAEQTIGLMLALARNLPQSYNSILRGEWDRKKYSGVELTGKTLGLIGFGKIGQETAKRATALGMNVIACDPATTSTAAAAQDVTLVGLDKLLASSDFVSLHMPLTAETRHLINKEALAKIKKGARIINCARGGIIDEEALAEVLKSGHIAGAAFDVFEKEPPDPTNPLLKLPNFICTPHLGAYTDSGQERVCGEVAKIVIAFAR